MFTPDTTDRHPADRSPGRSPTAPPDGSEPSAEQAEREAAWRRGATLARATSEGDAPPRDPYRGLARRGIAQRAFATLAENVRDYAIFLLDQEGVITFWGEGARLIKWWTKEEAEGAHLRLLYPDGGSEDGTAEEHLQTAAETGEYTGEGHRMRSDGSKFWAGVTLTALRDADGRLLGFAKVTRDLTAHRAAEAAHQSALRAAEEASRIKGHFVATMSHEIRTPLNAIMAYTDLLDMQVAGPLTEGQIQHLRKIRTSSQHLLGVVEDVLDLSRIEAGRMVPARYRLKVGPVIGQTMMMVEPQAAARRVELVDAVSDFSAAHWCWGDEERVRQVLVNLLSNAIKFTEPGGRVTVSAGTAAEPPKDADLAGPGPWVFVRVEDTGQGIPAERIGSIFEPFVQADMSLTRQHGGAGLGLSISRKLARLLGGDLTARSEVGVGSSFLLWLPAAEEMEIVAEPATGPTPRSTAGTLHDVQHSVLSQLERILHGYVSRLRSDPATPSARALTEAELEDHLASFLADVAQTFGSIDLAKGRDSEALKDGTAIQRTIAARHGRQRARLGWAEDELVREFAILREELAAAVRRKLTRPREGEVEEAIELLEDALRRAELISLETFGAGAPD